MRAADLAETSFAVSPLQETAFSLWVWSRPERQAFHLPWRTSQLATWNSLDSEVLDALIAPHRGWLPDFLTPRPRGPFAEFAAELASVADTPLAVVRRDVASAYGGEPVPAVLRGNRAALLRRIVAALDEYWQRCLAPSWARIRAVLEADIVYRSRRLALGGARGLFADLDARVRWRGGGLYVDRLPEHHVIHVDGRGLPLIPSIFCRGAVTYISPDEPPVLGYPARGRATVWAAGAAPPAEAALAGLLGAPRARLLAMLARPATTTELARRLGVTPAAVSQHLRVLRAARLVNRAPSGRAVLYLRSRLGDDLAGCPGRAGTPVTPR